MSSLAATTALSLIGLPKDIHVNILSYLRAYDLSSVQQACRFFNNADLIDSLVQHICDHVYSRQFSKDISMLKDKEGQDTKYTLQHLRMIEVGVVARVLSLPEPKQGFYVSKSWIKKTLLWLETVNEVQASPGKKKKLNKKQQRQRARRLSDVCPPWPNANSDILCCHQNLQRCGVKAARSRRRLMDKQAWKILKKLYPDSTSLESVSGECLQCVLDTETTRKNEHDRMEKEKAERKKPLAHPLVRKFYTRSRGIPTDCLIAEQEVSSGNFMTEKKCPLKSGSYFILSRGWCHQWRKYMKTGEGAMPEAPDSSALLCHAHKYALLPPHLEAFLEGKTSQLLSAVKGPPELVHASANIPGNSPIGVPSSMDADARHALLAAGMSPVELAAQRMAMLQLQQQQQQQQEATLNASRQESASLNDVLDRENHIVVELVTEEEWEALNETGGWPRTLSHFAVRIVVDRNQKFHLSSHPCRECDATGSRYMACAEVKYRRKRWEPKSVEQKRIPQVEY